MPEALLFLMGLVVTVIVGLAVWSVGRIETVEDLARYRGGRGEPQSRDVP